MKIMGLQQDSEFDLRDAPTGVFDEVLRSQSKAFHNHEIGDLYSNPAPQG